MLVMHKQMLHANSQADMPLLNECCGTHVKGCMHAVQYDDEDLAFLAKKKEVSRHDVCWARMHITFAGPNGSKNPARIHVKQALTKACLLKPHASKLTCVHVVLQCMLPLFSCIAVSPLTARDVAAVPSCQSPAKGASCGQTSLLQGYCVSCLLPLLLLLLCMQEEKALKALKEKAKGGAVGGAGLKKSGKK